MFSGISGKVYFSSFNKSTYTINISGPLSQRQFTLKFTCESLTKAGKKEVKIIESDEAYRSRIAEHKGLAKFESVRAYTPIFIILLLTLGYCINYDHFTEPPPAWVRKWHRERDENP